MTPSFPRRLAPIAALFRPPVPHPDDTASIPPPRVNDAVAGHTQQLRFQPAGDRHAARISAAELLSLHDDAGFIPLFRVLHPLQQVGIIPVIIGGVALSCWSGRPRANAEHDLVVAAAAQLRAHTTLQAAFPQLDVLTDGGAKGSVRFVASTGAGPATKRIELHGDRSPIHRLAMEHALMIRVAGGQVRLPTPEALLVLKTASASSITRSTWARRQDEADIALLIESCPWMKEEEISVLAKAISPALCVLIREVVHECRALL
jgi:hypothetical protein